MTTSTHEHRGLVRPAAVLSAQEEAALVGFNLTNPGRGVIENRQGTAPVTIAGTDVMFSSVGCGTWTKIG